MQLTAEQMKILPSNHLIAFILRCSGIIDLLALQINLNNQPFKIKTSPVATGTSWQQ